MKNWDPPPIKIGNFRLFFYPHPPLGIFPKFSGFSFSDGSPYEDEFNYEEDLKYEVDFKYEFDLKYEDKPKYEDILHKDKWIFNLN